MTQALTDLGRLITARLGDKVADVTVAFGEVTVSCAPADIVAVLTVLRDDPDLRFCYFIDVSGADYPERDKRFDVVYHLADPYKVRRLRVKVRAGEGEDVPTVTAIYPGANWYEREVFDLYGVVFAGHPDLRRILTDYGFSGHPLRKDFPLTGHVEVRYDDELKRVVYEPVKLAQEFRQFDYLSPWEGGDYVLPGDEKAKS